MLGETDHIRMEQPRPGSGVTCRGEWNPCRVLRSIRRIAGPLLLAGHACGLVIRVQTRLGGPTEPQAGEWDAANQATMMKHNELAGGTRGEFGERTLRGPGWAYAVSNLPVVNRPGTSGGSIRCRKDGSRGETEGVPR